MRIDGSVAYYLLTQAFDDVVCDKAALRMLVDYPILYDVEADMNGHLVLVPEHERPSAGLLLTESICLCLNSSSAESAHEAGYAVIHIHDSVRFPHLYNYLQQAFVHFERLDALLRAYVYTRSNAQAILDACAQATGCPLFLVDEQYRGVCEAVGQENPYVAAIQQAVGFETLEEDGIDLLMASRNYRHMRLSNNVFTVPGASDLPMKNLFVEGSLKGVVMSRHEGTALSARYVRFFLKYIGSYLELLYAQTGSFGVVPTESDRIRAALASLLSEGKANYADVQSLLLENGHTPESHYVVLRIERSFTYEGAEGLTYLAHCFEQAWPRAYCFAIDNVPFMLADISPSAEIGERDFFQDILITARENLSKVGISRPFVEMEQLDAARFQATIALKQGSISDPTFWFYRFSDYALPWLIEHGWSTVPFAHAAHPAVLEVMRYDSAHGTELLHTLSTFLNCRFNATKAAENLFVARSTLLNRLDRIVAMTGIDLENTDDILYLELSLARIDKLGAAVRHK